MEEMTLLEKRRAPDLRPLYILSSLALATSTIAILLCTLGTSGYVISNGLATQNKWAGKDTDIVPYGFEKCDTTDLPTQVAPVRLVGDFAFLSGVLGYNVPCQSAIQDPRAQIIEAFRTLNYTLSSASMRLRDVDSVTSYHKNMKEHLHIFIQEREKYFNEMPFPAWTAVGVASLYFDGQVLELSAVARRPPCNSLECSR